MAHIHIMPGDLEKKPQVFHKVEFFKFFLKVVEYYKNNAHKFLTQYQGQRLAIFH